MYPLSNQLKIPIKWLCLRACNISSWTVSLIHFNVHILDASPFTYSISKLVISCNSQKLRPCSEILMVKRNIIFLNSHIALCCSLINFSPLPPGLSNQWYLLIFFPHWRNLVVFFEAMSLSTIPYIVLFFGIIPISSSKSRGNFQYCFLLSRGDVGAMQSRLK